jgi:hypothetical protein
MFSERSIRSPIETFFKTPDLAIVRPTLVNPRSSSAVSVVIDEEA